MDLQLQGRTALVTASTGGIGRAIACALAREGATVHVNGRTEEGVAAALRHIADRVPGAALRPLVADGSTADGVAAMLEALPAVDLLVNNLGIYDDKPFLEADDAAWFRSFEANVMSGVRLARHYLPRMLHRGSGRIVFVSSESALQIPVEMIHYGMTKTAQLAVARGLAETLTGTNVTVNSVLPGPTASEGVGGFIADLAASKHVSVASMEREFFATARPTSILQRFATPEEVAAMIVYVCSARASATTGAALRVDGGVVRAIV